PSMQPYYFFFAIALSFVVAGSIGWVVERVMISRLYHRPLDTLLATWGLSLVMQQALRSIFGAREVSA
ncbi:Branched-chain amino acid ABC transporter, permease protein, partial [Pseudomonas syringae pv. maculicola]